MEKSRSGRDLSGKAECGVRWGEGPMPSPRGRRPEGLPAGQRRHTTNNRSPALFSNRAMAADRVVRTRADGRVGPIRVAARRPPRVALRARLAERGEHGKQIVCVGQSVAVHVGHAGPALAEAAEHGE